MKKIQLQHLAGPFGDCTSAYGVYFPEDMTVWEFITTAIQENTNEWGVFSLGVFSPILVEYKYGAYNLRDEEHLMRIKDFHIEKVSAHGGWSNMDYYITTKEREELPNDDISYHQFKN